MGRPLAWWKAVEYASVAVLDQAGSCLINLSANDRRGVESQQGRALLTAVKQKAVHAYGSAVLTSAHHQLYAYLTIKYLNLECAVPSAQLYADDLDSTRCFAADQVIDVSLGWSLKGPLHWYSAADLQDLMEHWSSRQNCALKKSVAVGPAP